MSIGLPRKTNGVGLNWRWDPTRDPKQWHLKSVPSYPNKGANGNIGLQALLQCHLAILLGDKDTILFIHLSPHKKTLSPKKEQADSSSSNGARGSVPFPRPNSSQKISISFHQEKHKLRPTRKPKYGWRRFIGCICYSCIGLFEVTHVAILCLVFSSKKKNQLLVKLQLNYRTTVFQKHLKSGWIKVPELKI